MTNVDLVRLAGSRARISDAEGVDPVTAEVIRGGMETVCFEMAEYVSRTATTPILNQSNERNATVLDAHGRLAALSVGIPQFMLTSTLAGALRARVPRRRGVPRGRRVRRQRPVPRRRPPPRLQRLRARVRRRRPNGGRRMVLIASIQCHHGDTGGGVPGGYNITATDIWGEGVRWPVVKVIDRGVERRDVLYALQVNNRIPSLHRRPARADRLRAARRAAARRDHRPLRRGDGRGQRRLDDRRTRPAASARKSRQWPDGEYEARRVRRPRPARQSRRAPAREGHGRRRLAHHRLHRLRHAHPSSRRGRPTATRAGTRSARSPR